MKTLRIILILPFAISVVWGLAKLKAKSESVAKNYVLRKQTEPSYTITEKEMPAMTLMGIRQQMTMPEVGAFFQTTMPKVYQALQKNKIVITGPPAGLYYSWDQKKQTVDMAVAVPVKKAKDNMGEIQTITIPAGTWLTTDYYGPYDKVGPVYQALDKYMHSKGYGPMTLAVEQYMTEPGTQPDTSKWLTRISYVIKK